MWHTQRRCLSAKIMKWCTEDYLHFCEYAYYTFCVFLCVMHHLLYRRLTVATSRGFQIQCWWIFFCWTPKVKHFPLFSSSIRCPVLSFFFASLLFSSFVTFLPLHLSPPPLFPSVTDVCGNGLTLHPRCVIWGIWGVICNRKVTDLGFAVCHLVTLTLSCQSWNTFVFLLILTFKLKSSS